MLTSYNQYYCAWFAPNYIYLQFQKHRPTLEHDVGYLNTWGVSLITGMEPNSVSTPIMLTKTVGLLMFPFQFYQVVPLASCQHVHFSITAFVVAIAKYLMPCSWLFVHKRNKFREVIVDNDNNNFIKPVSELKTGTGTGIICLRLLWKLTL